ncbi:unnamed protein product [Angiostrongylus costaricensis]|uniref:Transcriptional regulator n=1 Tax=Angiostrongylus costaricensis TaxID=334426 RepID=A0A0R3PMH4_ANGCS|nr:unnamed protein product [Angiostrongylus costaricensis]
MLFRQFRSDDFNLEVKEGRGCPGELEDDELKALVDANARAAVRELVEQLGESTEYFLSDRIERQKN